ncbi:ABC transporter substrate-binding protein [Bifidobacterium pseudolongum]|uniref:Solute binding protein of ABC transporter n=1 Tax=Bifidobacterium pseudolongum subsp. pseudolongum TaxID=31954 RepID=A0A4V1Y277_9BIFI|nr:extracellular solute-binding protein [Bifidobacterium pseudolongum]PKV06958.1 Solute binding protein of ABC transporter [Bifidobacterium pseudolongum subsp. pseudolongum]RYQ18860.1 Solute binding protein of ABC transporter [Bifidobacterium pseudolongum subsp. pseudolongum]RYQ47399.1 Solute binding protein of ABC transporter [Bifidobacterium pseudolongum subsp. pseudolongum]RYQ50330.1 Solute binding protein of ABC transporter [Bifidobacterium pseudolongum subsp. pseudolongum]RYQ51416.1 Solut
MKWNKGLMAGAAAVAAACMALSGCGGASSGGSSSSSSGSVSNGGKVEITYIHRLPDKSGMTSVEQIVSRWNKENPNIQVKPIHFNGNASDLIKKLETDVKAGNAPDLAQAGYSEIPELFTKGLLEDVTAEADQYKGDFAEGPYGNMTIGGKTFGLPQDTGPLVYYYNKTEFDKLGISVPKTQGELLESAKKAAAQGKYIMSFQADEAGNMLSGLAGASDPWYTIEGDAWKVDTQTSGSKAVAKVYQQLLDDKAATTNPRWDPSFDASLQKGELIGTIGAAWEAPLLMDSMADKGKGDWRVAQIGDWFDNGEKTGPDGGSGVVALKGIKHKAEAMKFLDWFNTQIDDLTSQGLVVAATTGSAKTPASWSEFYGGQDVMAEFAAANGNLASFSYIPGFSAVGTAMKEKAADAADGKAKVETIFDVAQTASVDTLKDYGLSVAQ